jgi:hypothetical protein
VRLHKSIIHSNDAVLKHLVEVQGPSMHERYLHELQLGGTHAAADISSRKNELAQKRRIDYAGKVHGAGFEIFSTCPLTNKWLVGDCKSMTAQTYIGAIKLRTNSIETKVTCSRGLNVEKTCSRCGLGQESVSHILQVCNSVKGMRYRRHHNICFRVAKKLRENGYSVFVESAFPVADRQTSTARPDIVAVKDMKALVLDVTCVYENSGATFINSYAHKVNHYKALEGAVKAKHDCTDVSTHGLVIGSRGSYYHGHLHLWRSLGFSDTELGYLALGCLEDSLRVVSVFRKDTGGDPRRGNSGTMERQ